MSFWYFTSFTQHKVFSGWFMLLCHKGASLQAGPYANWGRRRQKKGPSSQEAVFHFPPTSLSLGEPVSKEPEMKMDERKGEATWEPG